MWPNADKGIQNARLENKPCFIHTLELVIKEIFTERSVNNVIGISRKKKNCVDHFYRSALLQPRV